MGDEEEEEHHHPLSRRQVLLTACLAWYEERPEAARDAQRVLKREGKQLSLRVVEYFLNTRLRVQNHKLYWAYQRHLRIFGKAHFDVFCREPKKTFKLGGGVEVESTPAQLEFLRWFIESGGMSLLLKDLDAVLLAKQLHQGATKKRKHQQHQQEKKQKQQRGAAAGVCCEKEP